MDVLKKTLLFGGVFIGGAVCGIFGFALFEELSADGTIDGGM